ncbi:hypothetical protein AB0L57_25475 [Nocardia sp. NPDC052254]|uniref:hypothetical protein n=1 Tax=Nocardia sp. NPDC052254 TaxID=3155681 RepID=UPI003413000C
MGDQNQPAPFDPYFVAGVTNPGIATNRSDANQAQHGAQQVQDGIHHGSTDPAYIKDTEPWDTLQHQEIYTMVHSITPGIMHDHATAWNSIAAAVGGGLFGLNLSIHKELSDGFHGQFAGAAEDAANKFIQQATDIQEVITAVGARIHAAAYGAEAAQLAVPPPGQAATVAPTGSNDPLTNLGAMYAGTAIDNGTAAEEQKFLAREAMKNNYNPTYRPAGENVPTFVPVDSPGDGGANNPDSGGPNSSSGPNAPGNNTSGDQQEPGDQGDKPDSEQSEQTDPASASPAGQGDQASQKPSSTPGSLSSGDTRPGADSTTAAGYGGPGSRFGSSGGPGGASGGQLGGPGQSIPGTPGGVNPAAAAAFGGKPGQAGVGGMPGMGGLGGARKNEESEREHKTPDYLIMDREEELLGIRDRTLPEAIGGDAPSAQFRPEDREHRR